MSRFLDTGEVKALFRVLVKAAGGVEACAVELGISFQRVSHLQNVSNSDEPTFRQIRTLEVVAGAAIVSGAQMRAIEGQADEMLSLAVVESVQATAAALGALHAMEADGVRTPDEVRDVQLKTRRAADEAVQAADAAARIKPGRVGEAVH